MALFIDNYGNEARVLIEAEQFGRAAKNGNKAGKAGGGVKKTAKRATAK